MGKYCKVYKGEVINLNGVKMVAINNLENTEFLQEGDEVMICAKQKDEFQSLIDEAFEEYDETFRNLVDR